MALSRTGKVSRSFDRQRRIPKNSLYLWNNWCTCPRGGSDFNFCPPGRNWNPGRGKICTPRRVAVSLSWVRTQAISARWTYSRYFRGAYLSMTFNIVTLNIVTRLTFLQATNACTRVWFSAQDARMHAYYRVSFRYLRKVS